MRKVYQEENSRAALAAAGAIALGFTAVLFCVLPFTHLVAKRGRTLELRKAGVADLPPPQEERLARPEPARERPPESLAEPQLAETQPAVPLSADLEVAAGSGGALAGFGEVRALTAVQPIQDETFDASELEKRPEALTQVAPTYPAELRKTRIEGLVTLVFVLSEQGRVEEPRVENASRPEFERPALEAIRKWRFRPGMKDGRAVRTYIRLPMRFRVATS